MSAYARSSRAALFLVLFALTLAPPVRTAPTAPPSAATAEDDEEAPAKPRRSTTRTLEATVAGVDAGVVRLALAGSVVAAKIHEGSRFTRQNREAQAGAFAAGEKVTARLTYRPDGEIRLSALWDAPSYAVYSRDRREIAVGVVAERGAGRMEVRRADGSTVAFRVTEKSRVQRGGAPASPSDFPAGARVAVKPRSLPSGDVMAWIVAETEGEVTALYLDGLVNWEGAVESVDAARGTLAIRRSDGALRAVAVTPTARVSKAGQPLALKNLAPGVSVEVHLVRGAGPDGPFTADAVTIVAPKPAASMTPK